MLPWLHKTMYSVLGSGYQGFVPVGSHAYADIQDGDLDIGLLCTTDGNVDLLLMAYEHCCDQFEATYISTARVPVLKMRYHSNVQLDISCLQVRTVRMAQTDQPINEYNLCIPAYGLSGPAHLQYLQPVCGRRCLSYFSVLLVFWIKYHMKHVPHVQGVLQFLRHWAKERALYGTLLGYPCGAAWAVMAVRAVYWTSDCIKATAFTTDVLLDTFRYVIHLINSSGNQTLHVDMPSHEMLHLMYVQGEGHEEFIDGLPSGSAPINMCHTCGSMEKCAILHEINLIMQDLRVFGRVGQTWSLQAN